MAGEALKGKVAMVTGAAGGFGSVLVRALLADDASVVALDVNERGLAALKGIVTPEQSKRLMVMATDISDYAACERAVAEAIAKLGGLHIVINNGALGMGAIRSDHMVKLVGIREITPQVWERFV